MNEKTKELIYNTDNIDLINLRLILLEAYKKVGRPKLVKLLKDFGVEKLSDLPEDKYQAFQKELVKLLN